MNVYSIYDNISLDSLEQMRLCFLPRFKEYSPGEVIMRHSCEIKEVAVLLTGKARLYTLSKEGDYILMETYEKNQVFGELFCLPLPGMEYITEATDSCKVMFLDYDHIITPCEKTCPHHSQLINNLFLLAAERSRNLSLHINILSRQTTKDKLMAYFKSVSAMKGNNTFTIPLSLTALSEYLCVDRSAMMREIKLMKKDGLISSDRRRFQLLTDDDE